MTQIFDGFPSRDQLGFVFNGWGWSVTKEELGDLIMNDEVQTEDCMVLLFAPEIIKGKGEN